MNKFYILFAGLFYAVPIIAFILPIVIDSFGSNFDMFTIALTIISVAWWGGMSNVKLQDQEDELNILKNEIEKIKNESNKNTVQNS